jgi:4-amino-4-deoxy-L-arabinose transferase-like glycosyltransferase
MLSSALSHNTDKSFPLLVFAALCVSVFFAFFFNIYHFPLFDVDEGAFSSASREMLLHHDFISITLNGEPRYDKPILIYWLQSFSAWLFGNHEFAYRLPSAIAASCWAGVIYWFARKRFSTREGIIAALLMSTTIQIAVMGKAATADATLNLFIAGSLFNLYLYLEENQDNAIIWAALFTALGMLTKGPIAPALAVIISALYCVVTPGRWSRWLSIGYNLKAWLIFLVIVTLWPVMLYLQEGEGFFREFLLVHNVGRFSSSMEGHSGNYAYYLIAMLIGFIPHTSVLLASLFNFRVYWQMPLGRYVLIWFGFVFVFFTFSATKLPHYLIYGSSGLFVLMSLRIQQLRQSFWLYLPQLLLASVLIAAAWVLQNQPQWIQNQDVSQMLTASDQAINPGFYLYLALFIALSLYFSLEKKFSVAQKLITSGVLLNIFLAAYLMPALATFQQTPVKQAGLIASQLQQPIINWRITMPSFNIYAERPSVKQELQPGYLVFTRSKFLHDLPAYTVLYQNQGIALVGLEPFPDSPAHGTQP